MIDRESIEAISQTTGVKIKEVDIVRDNEIFQIISSNIGQFLNRKSINGYTLNVLEREIWSVVETPDGGVLKVHNSLDFILGDGSVVRYSSKDELGLELTRIKVAPENRGNGVGNELMIVTLGCFEDILGFIPEITLECTGAIGISGTNSYEETSLEDQMRFFRKFQFQVLEMNLSRGFVRMFRPIEGEGVPWSLPYPPLDNESSDKNRG